MKAIQLFFSRKKEQPQPDRVDNTPSREPEILLKAQVQCTKIDRNGSRGLAAGRGVLNGQQALDLNTQIAEIHANIKVLRGDEDRREHAKRKAQRANINHPISHIPQVGFPYALLINGLAELMTSTSTQRAIKKCEREVQHLESMREQIKP